MWPALFKVFGDMLMNKSTLALTEVSFYCMNTDNILTNEVPLSIIIYLYEVAWQRLLPLPFYR